MFASYPTVLDISAGRKFTFQLEDKCGEDLRCPNILCKYGIYLEKYRGECPNI